MRTLSAEFAVTTPLFGGGADPKMTAELRPPSVKGVLRFWWRALAWSRYGGKLDAIHAEEAEIFGAAGDGKTGRQASFLLRVHAARLPKCLPKGEVLEIAREQPVDVGARSFGYGLMEAFGSSKKGTRDGQLTRPCLPTPLDFTVALISRKSFDPTLLEALKLMGLLGGLGSRTRRGWGSLTLTSLQGDTESWEAPADVPGYRQALRDILKPNSLAAGEPPYSAFSDQTRIEVVGKGSDPLRLLNTVGEQMLRYRSWGKNGKVDNVTVDQNFADDHDWFKASDRAAKLADGRPRRVIFGLPHNYSQQFHVTASSYDRRASPLLVHVHRLTEELHIAVLTVLRSAFLPTSERLKVTNGRAEGYRDAAPDWAVLDRFIDGTSATPYFPDRTRVLP